MGETLLTVSFYNHYENLPMQYTEIFIAIINENFRQKKFDIFLIFAQNIDFGRGGSNEYPQSTFWSKNKKKYVHPCIPQFCYIKVVYKGVYITRTLYHYFYAIAVGGTGANCKFQTC